MSSSAYDGIQELGDLELAVLVSLVAEEQLICSTEASSVRTLQEELRLICLHTFGLHSALVECTSKTTVDDFNDAILVEAEHEEDDFHDAMDYHHSSQPTPTLQLPSFRPTHSRLNSISTPPPTLDERRVADVIIATNLHRADESVQTQGLELLRTRRIFTRAAMHTTSKDLLFIAVLPTPPDSTTTITPPKLTHHLNDLFGLSHHHPTQTGWLYTQILTPPTISQPKISPIDLSTLRAHSNQLPLPAEIAQYLHNLVIFLRTSRYIKSGITAPATRSLRKVSCAMATLHGPSYVVTPSVVALAARKVYGHRARLVDGGNERSLMWGSERRAVEEMMAGLEVGEVLEVVIGEVEVPL